MSEQVFKSPGFFEREIEIQAKPPRTEPNSSPVGIIGPAEKGPAFIPVILNSLDDYKTVFGKINKDKLAGHAVSEFFKTKNNAAAAVQFIRTLGLNQSSGFKLTQSGDNGGVQFLCAEHLQATDDKYVNGMFAFNKDIDNSQKIKLVRGILFLHKSCHLTIDETKVPQTGEFTINVVSNDSSINSRTVKASLNPVANNYIANVLNTNPYALEEYGYVLYSHFPIDDDFLTNKWSGNANPNLAISLVRPRDAEKAAAYGNFQTSFKTPQTTSFISQPFGNKEYELFSFEAIDDGAFAAGKYKISISGLRASTDINYKFGTFNVQLRDLNDTDEDPIVLESYTNCSLDPTSSNYIAKLIGDQKKYYTYYDASNNVISSTERRIYTEGENPNQSTRIRVKMSADVINGEIPEESLPFGFRGLPSLKTKDATELSTSGYILPPLPYRFKVTAGALIKGTEHQSYIGKSTSVQTVSAAMHWGLMNFNIDAKETANNRATSGDRINRIVENYTKLMAVDSSILNLANSVEADDFNNHKFTLARVAFAKAYSDTAVSDLSTSIAETFKEAIYVRNGDYMNQNYTITNALLDNNFGSSSSLDTRITMATVLSESKEKFNRFSAMAKFTAPMFGGFDGLNIFDKDSMNMNDRASSTENTLGGVTGKAIAYPSGLSDTSSQVPMHGDKKSNVVIEAYQTAADIMLEPATAIVHVVLLPGIRDSLVASHVTSNVEQFGKAMYLMDIPHYDRNGVRLYDDAVDDSKRPDVDQTISYLAARNIDSSYAATYFPDVLLDDESDSQTFKRVMRCPSSIIALGALAKSETKSDGSAIQPWFAPAGFENGLNTRVRGVTSRLRADDRDSLYEARINPIASFPSNQYVIFGQKTLQVANTALTRVNVRRLMIEIKRGIERIAQSLLFEQNNEFVRNNFLLSANAFLSNVQVNSGIENFRVTLLTDESDMNSLTGKIIIVPTRVVEFIAMDFVITNSGVTFA